MTTQTKAHTPGPLVVSENVGIHVVRADENPNGRCIVADLWHDTPQGYTISYQEALANGQLFAAAPALLEAAEHFREWFANHFGDFDAETNAQLLCLDNEAEAAIRQAKGEA